jgi:competence protein ComGC
MQARSLDPAPQMAGRPDRAASSRHRHWGRGGVCGERRLRGFTLVELFVVIAILVAVGGFLFPVLAGAREHARRTSCLSQLRQIGTAHLLYLEDWNEQFPDWRIEALQRRPPIEEIEPAYWTEYLQPYLRSRAILRDPSMPPWREGDGVLADYTLATWGPGGRGSREDPYYRWPGPPLSLAQVSRPAATIHVADGRTTRGWTGVDGIRWNWAAGGWVPDQTLRHTGGLNACFLDRHARWLRPGEFWRTEVDRDGYHWLRHAAADRHVP